MNGLKFWVGTATFPEALWNGRAITDAVWANIEKARADGAQFHFSTKAEQLEKTGGRVTAVIARDRNRGYIRFRAKQAVILAAGDFAHSEEMVRDLCQEAVDLAPKGAKVGSMFARDGSGIRMGVWAGGRLTPGPRACMGGTALDMTSPLGVAATLWLNGENRRYCNEGFGGGEFAGLETARQQPGMYVTVFDDKIDDLLQRQAPCHSSRWVSNPEDPFMVTALSQIEGARAARTAGFSVPSPFSPKEQTAKLYAADTLEELADCLGYDGQLKENFLNEIARYNELCAKAGTRISERTHRCWCLWTRRPITECRQTGGRLSPWDCL